MAEENEAPLAEGDSTEGRAFRVESFTGFCLVCLHLECIIDLENFRLIFVYLQRLPLKGLNAPKTFRGLMWAIALAVLRTGFTLAIPEIVLRTIPLL